jgi:hypothetical protein
VRAAIQAHLGSPQVARVVYGSIIGLALVVALEAHPPGAGVVVGTLLGTGVAVALAEVYSEVVGSETRNRRRLERAEVRDIAVDISAVGFGICFPAVFFVLAAAGAIEVETAFAIAKWSGLGLIGCYGFAGARLAGASFVASLAHAVAVGVIGGVLIALKALLH